MKLNYFMYKMCKLKNQIRYIIALIKIRMIKFIAGTNHIMIGFKLNIPQGKTGIILPGSGYRGGAFIAENHFEANDSNTLLELNIAKKWK